MIKEFDKDMTASEVAKKKIEFLEYYSELPNQKLGANYIGVDEDTITNWKKTDSDFSDQAMHAKAEWARAKAKGIRNKEWLLERVLNDHFGQRIKKELSGELTEKIELILRDGDNDRETKDSGE